MEPVKHCVPESVSHSGHRQPHVSVGKHPKPKQPLTNPGRQEDLAPTTTSVGLLHEWEVLLPSDASSFIGIQLNTQPPHRINENTDPEMRS
jgi:hypothetical protein